MAIVYPLTYPGGTVVDSCHGSPTSFIVMTLLFKALLGALVVMLIALLSKTRYDYIAGLLPLFSTFALLAHYIVGSERGSEALRMTILFGIQAVIPYLVYLISLYGFVGAMRLPLGLK